MEKLSQHVDQMDLFSDDQQDWASSIFADAQQLPFDGEGRILLSDSLKEHANLDEMVAFVGRGPTFQVWNPEDFQRYQQTARQRLKEQKLSLGALKEKEGVA
jgi:MraZ protein